METSTRRQIEIFASAREAYAGIIRLLLDAERFGFDLVDVRLTKDADAQANIHVTVKVDPTIDCDVIELRLGRHPVLGALSAVESRSVPPARVRRLLAGPDN